jgi:hypothetical protein
VRAGPAMQQLGMTISRAFAKLKCMKRVRGEMWGGEATPDSCIKAMQAFDLHRSTAHQCLAVDEPVVEVEMIIYESWRSLLGLICQLEPLFPARRNSRR